VGYDPSVEVMQQAQRKHQSVDRTAWDMASAVQEAAFVVITLPTRQVRQALADMAPHLAEGAIVSDTASTKGIVLRWAAELLPPSASFVGGHPLPKRLPGGLALESDDAPHADMFQVGVYCIMPLPSATDAAVNQVISLATLLGAQPYFVDPLEHDSFMAAVMHLPSLMGAALMQTTAGSTVWRELGALAGGVFRDVSRPAGLDPAQARDALIANREPLLHWLDRYLTTLADLRQALVEVTDQTPETAAAAEQQLETALTEAHKTRADWLRGTGGTAGNIDAELQRSLKEASSNRFSQNMLGGWLRGRLNPQADGDQKERGK
jgi:prephenate dehydrogenase